MKTLHILEVLFLVGVFGVAVAGGQEASREPIANRTAFLGGQGALPEPIPNWSAPATWSPTRSEEGLTTMGAVTSPFSFIGLTPCRIADTRLASFPAGYGPPSLAGGAPRNFPLTGQCGIPSSAAAVSLNVTVTNTQGAGFILIYPQGGAQPNVSTLNYVAGQTIANAAVVPLGAGGGVTVIAGVSGTDFILDTNGYYGPSGVGTHNTFLGLNAGNFTMTGDENTGLGYNALVSNTTGSNNSANGSFALSGNTMGNSNTANGQGALFANTTGHDNSASGAFALENNTMGNSNTANGSGALFANTTGTENTADGAAALGHNTGSSNTANGAVALFANTTGSNNTASGDRALVATTTGSSNIGIGSEAGSNLTTGSNNICIGNSGVAGESNTIRIGTTGTQTATYIAGIYNADATSGSAVFITPSGKLGTTMVVSSRRFKEDIREIAGESDGLMRLRPVAFKYKHEVDPTGLVQYGLIAEEVADVYPDLVAYDRDGRPETVRYHLVNALLLNEVQKQHRTVEGQQAEIEGLKARLSKLEARLLADSRP
jgi:hypothetical protein